MVNLGNFLTLKEKEIKNTATFISDSLPLVIGDFEWGAVEYPQVIQSLRNLEEIYGEPFIKRNGDGDVINNNEKEWFTVDNLLNYGSSVLVNRILDTDASYNAQYFIPSTNIHGKKCTFTYTNLDGDVTSIINDHVLKSSVTNSLDNNINVKISEVTEVTTDEYSVVLTDLTGYIQDDMSLTYYDTDGVTPLYTVSFKEGSNINDVYYDDISGTFTGGFDDSHKSIIKNDEEVEKGLFTPVLSDNELIRIFARYPGDKGNNLYITYCNHLAFNDFNYISGRAIYKEFDVNSLNEDELAIIVMNKLSSGSYEILERHIVSTDIDAQDSQGNSIYIEDYLLSNSAFIYGYLNDSNNDISETGLDLNSKALYFENPQKLQDGITVKADLSKFTSVVSNLENYDFYNFKYIVDSGFLNSDDYKKVLISLAESRKDCIAIIGLDMNDVTSSITGTKSSAITKMKQWYKDFNRKSTYFAVAGEYKYKRNRYNGKYFWTHMADDLAGLCVYADENYTPWNSTMGYEYGIIRDNYISRLGINYSGDLLDEVYRTGINPFILDDEGIVCLGNKTGYGDNTSDYSQLHIRRLLIFAEKNFLVIGKGIIGKVNDSFTRSRFKDSVEGFLNRIKAGRGLYDYLVVCDETNNTSAVIDNKEFIGDIYIKPTKLSEFVKINVINTSNDISFDEII
ncbi:MAG: phage tail sheath C-terminal domain-containing protein [Nanoarchaeota archaeon]